ncbi:MAG TPA: HAD family hydrolase [Candidatus Binatus sp.]|nr:HAD family hydrolase [Candidatus Binatus sp.]
MHRLILFDLDGTLIRSQNGYLPFNEAIYRTFGIEGDIRTVVPDGNTDPLIVKDIFTKLAVEIEIDESAWRRFAGNLRDCYQHHLQAAAMSIRAMPGAAELLRRLSIDEKFSASVVTGNFEWTAAVKLEAAGLALYLGRGAYASDSEYRPDLPAIAKKRFEQLAGRTIDPAQCVIVGDTPKDLEAARHNQMKCLLVGTGRYPVEELSYWQPDACLADLSDTETVLATLAQL